MAAKLVAKAGTTVTLEVTVELAGTFLESEEAILGSLNEAGNLATAVALEHFDADGAPIEVGGTRWYSKGRQPKCYEAPYGKLSVDRHVYQRSGGGKTFCPLEERTRMVGDATPRFAKMVSYKYANGSAAQVVEDLSLSHGRKVVRSYVLAVGERVAAVVQAKEEVWEYEVPELSEEVASVAVGLDGTCMLLCEDGWREAMTGTLSLYDKGGERLHTVYLGATPEYGKQKFYGRLDRELDRLKARYPHARYVGLADGEKTNWQFLEGKVSEQILDFYHASGYVGQAAVAVLPTQRQQWLDERCHRLKHEEGAAEQLLGEMKKLPIGGLRKHEKEELHSAVTYFTNHKEKMHYARWRAEGLPIGSGVTEAACKTLIKQRLCNAGMRWKDKGASAVISLRSLVITDGRWEQFWDKVNHYGVPRAA
jgi:hypothetical protein